MNIYKISQDKNDGYDTYDSAVVVARFDEDARNMHPRDGTPIIPDADDPYKYDNWVDNPELVKVELIGKTLKGDNVPRIICASFNAG